MGLSHATVMLVLALAIDGAFGELPNRLHPVAWFGALAARLRATLPLTPPAPALLGGVALVAAGMACVGVLLVTDTLLRERVPLLTDLAALFWLQASFAARALLTAGALVEQALVAGDLSLARARLGALCSRESAALSESELSGAAASSLAENLSDSVVAPLFYYALFGLGGALVFRVVNTLDAMVGYRGRYEWLGKPAARLDDLLGIVPARLSVGLLALAALALRAPVGRGLRVALRDAGNTPSPNGGFPMAMLAGVLGVRLEKADTYVLGAEGEPATAATLTAARRLVSLAALFAGLAELLLTLLGSPARGVWEPLGWPW